MTTMPSVMQELRKVLIKTRTPREGTSVVRFDQVSAKYPFGSERAVRRFEAGETGPIYENIDAMVKAYADAVGEALDCEISVFDLWDKAVGNARKAVEEAAAMEPSAASGAETAQRAVQAARRAAAETAPTPQRSPGKRSPKGSKRQAD